MKSIYDLKLSIIIPCYNEIQTIEQIINKILVVPIENKEIIVVDDYSTDGTREKLQNELSSKIDNLILHEKNYGKGVAIKNAIQQVTGDYTIIQDADLEYDPNEYILMLDPVIKAKADVVYGSRFITGAPHRIVYFWHRIGNLFLTILSNMFTNLNLTDMETCYKLFKSDLLKKINVEEKRFGFEPEITSKIARIPNIKIYEIGISYYGRTYSDGKKINWKDGFRAIYVILKYGIFK